MNPAYRDIELTADRLFLRIRLTLANLGRERWDRARVHLGWQFFDPETGRFIAEGQWTPIPRDIDAIDSAPIALEIDFPPETGDYRIYVSPIDSEAGWAYVQGARFLVVNATVANGEVRCNGSEITTRTALRLRTLRRAVPKAFTYPFTTLFRNRRLIRSMARRDILARYRGSAGDVLWTILNPLLLTSTYIFVFGFVLHARFAADQSPTGFVLYLLAGMLPWLAFSEPAGRAPHVVLEHRNFVKKLIYPLETLPVNQVVSGFVTELFAIAVFIGVLLVLRHRIPVTILWLPAIVIPQVLFTLGVCWLLAALGAFLRDLGQIMGFVLTLWFFLTPICYSEASLPAAALVILRKNPMYVLVRAYRSIFLEGHAPLPGPMLKFTLVAIVIFLLGHAWFYKLRKVFADVI